MYLKDCFHILSIAFFENIPVDFNFRKDIYKVA